MKSNADRIRMRVFKIWFFTLIVIVIVFAEKLTGIRNIPLTFDDVFSSLQIMTGLVLPQIGLMTAFYLNLDSHRNKLQKLSKEQVTIITMLSVSYHAIFILAVIFGIGFYAFDQTADGESLQRNTAAVVGIVGLCSVFLAPVAFLFAKSESNASESVSTN